jgi:hypothetical protein
MRNCSACYGMLCRQQASDYFLVSQAIELVVPKYKSKFESQHNGVVDFVTDSLPFNGD